MKSVLNILKQKKGVTLIELLVVVVILGIIAAVAIPAVMGNQTEAFEKTNEQNLKILEDAVARYNVFNTPLGTDDNDITILTSNVPNGGPFMPEIPVAHLVAGGTALFTLEDGVVTKPVGAY